MFVSLAQRRGFREYLTGLLAPRDRNKTLTALAGAEPIVGAQHPAVQRLQFFLTESTWDADKVNARRIEMLLAGPATAPHADGVLVIDDSGDRKDGNVTAHIGRQWLGRLGKTDNGIVTVTTLWADQRLYYPLHMRCYTPAKHFPKGKTDPAFRTKLQIGAELAVQAAQTGIVFRAVAADAAYGDQDNFRAELRAAGLPFVMALKPRRGMWQFHADAYTPKDAASILSWGGPEHPGDWTAVDRAFHDGHTERWWAAEARLGRWGPDGTTRLVVATTDPATLPDKNTWYLATDLPRPGSPREADSPHPAADLAEIVRIYGVRHWIEQGYKQVKDELGWADFQVRSATAIHRHQVLVCCAFSFCWDTFFGQPASADSPATPTGDDAGERGPEPLRPQSSPSWPKAIRAVRSWQTPWIALRRWWNAWSTEPPPHEIKTLIESLAAGRGLNLYLPP
ncbi:IS701 family transposase [Catenulispora sp. NF23]|nr:IS701 family transposase [Catenulispora pinistramenti]